MKTRSVFLFLLLAFVIHLSIAFSNSMPIYLEKYPAMSIAPMQDAPIVVDKEELVISVDDNSSSRAVITARYQLTNASDEPIAVPMLFPYISNSLNSVGATITLNGQDVPYQVFSAGHVSVDDYLDSPVKFNEQVDVRKIIKELNDALYTPQNFSDTLATTMYEMTFNTPLDRQAQISFSIEPRRTRVLAVGFSGFHISSDGECTVSNYVSQNQIGQKGYLLVLGKDTLADLAHSDDDNLMESIAIPNDFIMEHIITPDESNYPNRNAEDFYADFIEEVDNYFDRELIAFSDAMIKEEVMMSNNISALMYQVQFEAKTTHTMTVTYPMEATLDRRNSNDFVNTFAYLLNPARGFSEFGNLDITIKLNEHHPFIINSSIPLEEVEQGVYVTSLTGLPPEDLVFSTYTKREIAFTDRITLRLPDLGSTTLLVLVGAVILGFAVMTIIRKRLTR